MAAGLYKLIAILVSFDHTEQAMSFQLFIGGSTNWIKSDFKEFDCCWFGIEQDFCCQNLVAHHITPADDFVSFMQVIVLTGCS